MIRVAALLLLALLASTVLSIATAQVECGGPSLNFPIPSGSYCRNGSTQAIAEARALAAFFGAIYNDIAVRGLSCDVCEGASESPCVQEVATDYCPTQCEVAGSTYTCCVECQVSNPQYYFSCDPCPN